ncbi:glyoxalase [Paenarthrobacter ureafaciens]|uniref:VOC family protein n=1 Tax=Paenarthrobacter TaxID=1742992 RepID=UPI0015BEEF70|nr:MULTISPECIES: VOC family protein [Paenarthrobacter]NWL10407.1 glyoxalase [Paenarthrobacter nitroguajacolicus]NWL26729.1 glyoxalase [Paenarthrobacter ureafaciens]NWL32002.1 glyoxalase [Paenarthrobacter nitroguajacolicus]
MSETNRTESPVTVSKLGYVGFETPDLERLTDYYTKTLDFKLVEKTDTESYLTTTFEHHSIVLTKGGLRPRNIVGYEIAQDLESAEKRLRSAGYEVESRSDIAPGTPRVLIIEEPRSGTPIHLYNTQEHGSAPANSPVRPTKLGHVAAFTDDLGPTQAFYQDLLGFKWSDTIGDFFVFLRCNADHHAANFMASQTRRGMHHIAYEMRDLNHLQTLLDHLSANQRQLEWGPGRHGPGHNVFTYHKDPDGNVVELFTQLDTIVDEAAGYFEPRPWHTDHPQYPKTWDVDIASMNSWGPINPDMMQR